MLNSLKQKKLVCIGVVTGAHGVKGDVKIRSFTEMPEAFENFDDLEDVEDFDDFEASETFKNFEDFEDILHGVPLRMSMDFLIN